MNFRAADLAQFRFSLLTDLVDAAAALILPEIPSRTLRRYLERHVDDKRMVGGLFIPGDLPVVIHEGRRAFGPKDARFLVYFRDKNDDPRRLLQDPLFFKPQVRLTKDQFRYGLARNRALFQTNPAGGPQQFMVIVQNLDGSPGRVGPAEPRPFFEGQGHERFVALADEIAHRALDRFVQDHLIQETVPVRIVL